MGRPHGAVHFLGEDSAESRNVSQASLSGLFLFFFRGGARRGGLEAEGVGRERARTEAIANHRGLHVLPGVCRRQYSIPHRGLV